MGRDTSIGWTDATFNPWWGCVRVSPGCEHCYAETFAKRVGQHVWGPAKTTPRRLFGDAHWKGPEKWNAQAAAAGRRMRVFCASMADVFEDHPALPEPRARLFELIERTPHLDWQLLTKRPENVAGMVPWGLEWPDNVWIGASAEDQKRADERATILCGLPAAVRFLSCEPLLGPITLRQSYRDFLEGWDVEPECCGHRDRSGDCCGMPDPAQVQTYPIDWVIIGGESGGGARAMEIDWARDLVWQCAATGRAAFVKQLGAAHGNREDPKGEDIERFPEGLRVREFPRPLEAEVRS